MEWGLIHFQVTPDYHLETVATWAEWVFCAIRLQLESESRLLRALTGSTRSILRVKWRGPETAERWKRLFPSALGERRPDGFSY